MTEVVYLCSFTVRPKNWLQSMNTIIRTLFQSSLIRICLTQSFLQVVDWPSSITRLVSLRLLHTPEWNEFTCSGMNFWRFIMLSVDCINLLLACAITGLFISLKHFVDTIDGSCCIGTCINFLYLGYLIKVLRGAKLLNARTNDVTWRDFSYLD